MFCILSVKSQIIQYMFKEPMQLKLNEIITTNILQFVNVIVDLDGPNVFFKELLVIKNVIKIKVLLRY